MGIQKRTGQIVAILSLLSLLYAIFISKDLYWAIGSIIIGGLGIYAGWLI